MHPPTLHLLSPPPPTEGNFICILRTTIKNVCIISAEQQVWKSNMKCLKPDSLQCDEMHHGKDRSQRKLKVTKYSFPSSAASCVSQLDT